jgi:RND family efflux transporter MFP subunit
VAQAVREQAESALAVARTDLERAQAAAGAAHDDLAATVIRSPYDGVVLQTVAAAGEVTAAGYPVLAVGHTETMLAEIAVTDAEINALTPGSPVIVFVYGTEATYSGTVQDVGVLADSLTRTFAVRIAIEGADATLKSGMIARVTLESQGAEAILVPISAILHEPTEDVVFLYDEASGTAERRVVESGEISGDQVQILSGLEVGEILIVEGQYKLKPGAEVTP